MNGLALEVLLARLLRQGAVDLCIHVLLLMLFLRSYAHAAVGSVILGGCFRRLSDSLLPLLVLLLSETDDLSYLLHNEVRGFVSLGLWRDIH